MQIGERDDIVWDGNPPPGNASFRGLDIDAAGAAWTTTLQLAENPERAAVLAGTGPTSVSIEGVWEAASPTSTVQMDDAGETLAYTTWGPQVGGANSWVGPTGGEKREIEVHVDHATEVSLSDDGNVVHVLNSEAGMGHARTSFFEDAMSGAGRIKAHSESFGGTGLVGVELSRDGAVYAASVDIDPGNIVSFKGAMVGFRGLVSPGSPSATGIAFRIDEGTDALIVRASAEATGSDVIGSVRVLPLWNRYLRPSAVLATDADPFASWWDGAELTLMTMTEGGAGLYQASLPLDGKGAIKVADESPEPRLESTARYIRVEGRPGRIVYAGDMALLDVSSEPSMQPREKLVGTRITVAGCRLRQWESVELELPEFSRCRAPPLDTRDDQVDGNDARSYLRAHCHGGKHGGNAFLLRHTKRAGAMAVRA